MLTNIVAAESKLCVCFFVCAWWGSSSLAKCPNRTLGSRRWVGVGGGGENATQWGPHKTPNELR